MKKRIPSLILAVCVLFLIFALQAGAAESYSFTAAPTLDTPGVGQEFDVVISIDDLSSHTDGVRALQIDVGNIDPSVFTVVSHSTLVNDASAASDKTTYFENKNALRYVYLRTEGTMSRTVTRVMKFRLRVNDSLASECSVTLPLTYKVGTTAGNITVKDSLTISCRLQYVSVDISWGSMEFNYSDGTWDTVSHKRVGGGWEPASRTGNLITVENTGNTDVRMSLRYTPAASQPGLGGSFTDDSDAAVTAPVALSAESAAKTFRFHLSGEADGRWADRYVSVGSITLTLSD